MKVLAKPEEEILLVLPVYVDEARPRRTQELRAAFLNQRKELLVGIAFDKDRAIREKELLVMGV